MMRPGLGFAAGVLAAAGLYHLAVAAYIPAKAVFAQVLLERAWEEARRTGAAVRPWPWADTHPVARLIVPRLDQSDIVLAGASGRAMAFGPTHMDGSGPPAGPGHAVLTAHRDTHFAFLRDLRLGDRILVEVPGGTVRAYRVVGLGVADARTERIALLPDTDRLTLVTCYPFDAVVPGGALRFVVTADAETGDSPPRHPI